MFMIIQSFLLSYHAKEWMIKFIVKVPTFTQIILI